MLKFLDDPENYETDPTEESNLEYPSKNDMARIARDLYLRLFSGKDIISDVETEDQQEHDIEPVAKMSKAEELEAILSGSKQKKIKQSFSTPTEVLKIGHSKPHIKAL